MNAVIGLCHFCEAHGPKTLFCTFSTHNRNVIAEPSQSATHCTGCNSLGTDICLFSKEKDGTVFCSRESVPDAEFISFLRNAAMMSITCEVSWRKDGGTVYYSDQFNHILSTTFQLQDTQARGLKRWFSIVVVTKDKTMLLNLTPMLSQHMKTVAKTLQDAADKVFDEEQKQCSQRAFRLSTGRNDFGPSRSLIDLTGLNDVFQQLHSNFSWMLRVGANVYAETIFTATDFMNKFNFTNTFVNPEERQDPNRHFSFRELQKLMGKDVFHKILYCMIIGVKIIVKSDTKSPKLISSIKTLLPFSAIISNVRFSKDGEKVQNTDKLCVLEEISNKYKCNFNVPKKCPSLLIKMESAINSRAFNDLILNEHIKAMQIEWFGTIKVLNGAEVLSKSAEAILQMKQSLGVTQHDEAMIKYWSEIYGS